nr:hypothetical protein N8D75_05440 [Curtobacterium flaccumfaciens]
MQKSALVTMTDHTSLSSVASTRANEWISLPRHSMSCGRENHQPISSLPVEDTWSICWARQLSESKCTPSGMPAIAKALMARFCVGIFNPGRVGLIAPESFALGLPIVTAESAFHAPEFEYLRPGVDSIATNDSPEALAEALDELVARPERADRLARAADVRFGEYKLEDMVDQMQQSIEQLLRRSRA